MCRGPQFNQPMNRTAPAGRYVYSRRGKTNPKAPVALNPACPPGLDLSDDLLGILSGQGDMCVVLS